MRIRIDDVIAVDAGRLASPDVLRPVRVPLRLIADEPRVHQPLLKRWFCVIRVNRFVVGSCRIGSFRDKASDEREKVSLCLKLVFIGVDYVWNSIYG